MTKSLKAEVETVALQLADTRHTFQIGQVLSRLPEVSRQYVQPILHDMATRGLLVQAGKGRAAGYAAPEHADVLNKLFRRRLVNQNLEEHIVFDDLKRKAPFLSKLKENVFSIYDYAFQEMLNNAIDHSGSKTITIAIQQVDGRLLFEVKDSGIGIFANISSKLGLDNELAAIGELMKGKTTTDPDNHTGEGIYFTSKAADTFILESHDLRLLVDNKLPDVFIEELPRHQAGTRVRFVIDAKSKRHLSEIFRKYQTDPDDHAFNQTEIRVKLFTIGSVYVSRSQARRIMAGLDKKFQTVILDFDKVQTIGQAFADEIFRVYRSRHPHMTIRATNTVPSVQFMIDRAEATINKEPYT
jgi:anti-sigma regulatory factor (Ser/Thr protein kinase)